ncbi:hypothetical protein K504DRAFT_506136 [Pleomassaria siparia CBS 279.74]|uniref:Uncharacterized protein n=1 Tax=Pleomassaria siparia CBS 279.74 TaxID=1314801 RepID=A0A6G1JX41_9PLEO|nr:hypothetical protein K504DRAFT_506136 [Pleomassaria siparia CBS 279.74]
MRSSAIYADYPLPAPKSIQSQRAVGTSQTAEKPKQKNASRRKSWWSMLSSGKSNQQSRQPTQPAQQHGGQNTDKDPQNSDKGSQNSDKGSQNSDKGSQNSDKGTQNGDTHVARNGVAS